MWLSLMSFNSSFQDTVFGAVPLANKLTFNSSFQDTCSSTQCYCTLVLYFQFLILGYASRLASISKDSYFQFLILGYFEPTKISGSIVDFQFLILGYLTVTVSKKSTLMTFNSSFQDTGDVPIEGTVYYQQSFNSSFQDTH